MFQYLKWSLFFTIILVCVFGFAFNLQINLGGLEIINWHPSENLVCLWLSLCLSVICFLYKTLLSLAKLPYRHLIWDLCCLLSIAVTNPTPESDLGRKELIWLTFPDHSPSLREIRAGAWKQVLKQRPSRTALTGLLPSDFLGILSYSTQDHLPRNGTAHRKLGPPTSITNL